MAIAEMLNLEFDFRPVNPERLRAELLNIVGGRLVGISTGGGKITVHVASLADDKEKAAVEMAVMKHDATKLTPGQQKAVDHAADLELLRSKAWSDWTGADKDKFLRLLAEEWGLLGTVQG